MQRTGPLQYSPLASDRPFEAALDDGVPAAPGTTGRPRRLRVLSLPGRRNKQNRYFPLLCDGLEQAGAEIVDVKSKSALTLSVDVINVHFPELCITEEPPLRALALAAFNLAFFAAAKILGRKLVWSVHDLHPFRPRRRLLLRPYIAAFRLLVDGYMFLSASSRQQFELEFPREATKPYVMIPHGPYPTAPEARDATAVRRQLLGDQSAFLVGFLGDGRRYKNIEALLALPARLEDGRPVRVLVAGEPDPRSVGVAEAVLRQMPEGMVIRRPGRQSDAQLDAFIRACDVVFLPYRMGSNSGMAMLVLSNGGRILASGLPLFRELRTVYGDAWIQQFEDLDDVPSALEAIAAVAVTPTARAALGEKLARVDFDSAGLALRRFYETLVRSREPGVRAVVRGVT